MGGGGEFVRQGDSKLVTYKVIVVLLGKSDEQFVRRQFGDRVVVCSDQRQVIRHGCLDQADGFLTALQTQPQPVVRDQRNQPRKNDKRHHECFQKKLIFFFFLSERHELVFQKGYRYSSLQKFYSVRQTRGRKPHNTPFKQRLYLTLDNSFLSSRWSPFRHSSISSVRSVSVRTVSSFVLLLLFSPFFFTEE